MSQNVRSLNVSTKSDETNKKLFCITEKKSDIILLSDIRLNSGTNHAAVHNVTKICLLHGYKFIHNSTYSSRGVGILIKRSLNYSLIDQKKDDEGNFLLLKIRLRNLPDLVIGSIYGPNRDDMAFFDNLQQNINSLACVNVVLGGDWNATWDNNIAENNIDVINMASIPSKRRSDKIREMARNLSLTESYRIFYPTRIEYTYIPGCLLQNNRSRLDFFLCSENLMPFCNNCSIPNSLNSTVFDHKPIYLSFGKVNTVKSNNIKDAVLNDYWLDFQVRAAISDCYINHATVNLNFSNDEKNNLSNLIGHTIFSIRRMQELKIEQLKFPELDNSNEIENLELNIENFAGLLPNNQY